MLKIWKFQYLNMHTQSNKFYKNNCYSPKFNHLINQPLNLINYLIKILINISKIINKLINISKIINKLINHIIIIWIIILDIKIIINKVINIIIILHVKKIITLNIKIIINKVIKIIDFYIKSTLIINKIQKIWIIIIS